MSLKIRKATKKDLNQITKVLLEDYLGSKKEAREISKESIKNKTCLIAIEKEIVGILIYVKAYSHYANYIEDLIVSRKIRGKGIARKLIKKFLEISKKETPKNQRYALSSTDTSNKISIKMHKNLGFKEIGKIALW